jgi:hypothetical protein
MPFCPQCSYEYVGGAAECPDCKQALVAQKPSEKPDDTSDLDLEEIYTLPGLTYAEMVKEALEKEGIQCMLKTDVLTASHLNMGVGTFGTDARVLVKKEDAKKALKILHTMMDHI